MKFITEIYLRDLYKNKAFTVYKIDSKTRLTPGARQFLLDKKIEIINKEVYKEEKEEVIEKIEEKPDENWRKMKLMASLGSVEALFFIIIEESIDRDLDLAQDLIDLSKEVTSIKNSLENNTPIEAREIDKNLKLEKDIDTEITDFHIQLKRGKDILNLHRLRCLLKEVEAIVYQVWENDKENIEEYKNIIARLDQLVKRLSEKIYYILGGVK